MKISVSLRVAAVAVVLAAATAGCGQERVSGGACDVTVSTDTSSKPAITVPDCDKPTELQIRDIVEGSGAAAKAGDTVTVHYTGVSWSTQAEFDSSWGGDPYPVQPLGQAAVIDGWNQGLVGVKAGGRRLLVIPADLGYGARGNGPIAPNETLVFVVDVVSVTGS